MAQQDVINALFGALSFLAGWLLKNLHGSMRELREDNRQLAEKIAQINTIVAGQYVPRSEFDARIEAVFTKLDKIHETVHTIRVEFYDHQRGDKK